MSGQISAGSVAWLPDAATKSQDGLLVVGDLERWRAKGRAVAGLENVNFSSIAELDGNLLFQKAPDVILSPLVADEFDAVDVALKLIDIGFRGKYLAIADQPVDAQLIINEIRSLSENLDFDLLQIGKVQEAANDG
ncbi:MAG: hypothetical protein AAFQ09_00880 [Pseudomonadota bacterium]